MTFATSAMSDNVSCSDDSDWIEVAYYLSLHKLTSSCKHVTSDAINFVVCKHNTVLLLCLLRNLMH